MAVEKTFVQEGYVKASMNEFFLKQLSRAGYGGMELNRTPMGTQITIYAEKPGMVIGKAGKIIRKLTRDIDRLYDLDNPQIDAQEVRKPELNAQMMASRLASSIERGWYFRKAGHNTMRAIMASGALGCEIVISGKLTGSRSRVEKMVNGYIKHAGKPVDDIVDKGFATAIRKLGTLGCSVRIIPPDAVLPDAFKLKDVVEDTEAKAEDVITESKSEDGIKDLVKAEASGEVAEAEEVAEIVDKPAAKVEKTIEAAKTVEAVETVEAAETVEVAERLEDVATIDSEERKEHNGTWQHKHAGYTYWHPMARVHKETQ